MAIVRLRFLTALLLAVCGASAQAFGRKQDVRATLTDDEAIAVPLLPFATTALAFPRSTPGRVARYGLELADMLRRKGCAPVRKNPALFMVCLAPGHVISAALCALRSAWIVLTAGRGALPDAAAAATVVGDLVVAHKALLVVALRAARQASDWKLMESEEDYGPASPRWSILGKPGAPKSELLAALDHALHAANDVLASLPVVRLLRAVKTAPAPVHFLVSSDRGALRGVADGAALSHSVVLANGVSVPRIVFGTGGNGMDESRHEDCLDHSTGLSVADCKAQLDEAAIENIATAIKVGYRFLDTAQLYNNAALIGTAIKRSVESGVLKSADDMMISTKVGVEKEQNEGEGVNARAELERQMRAMGVRQLCSAQIHHAKSYTREQNLEARKQIAAMVVEGRVLAMGESSTLAKANFPIILAQQGIHVSALENDSWGGPPDYQLLSFARMNITVVAFDLFRDPGLPLVQDMLESITSLSGMSSPWALLYAWALRKRMVVLTTSSNEKHMWSSLHEPFRQLPRGVFAATDSLAWLTALCPPCASRNDGFGILNGMYKAGGTWEAMQTASIGVCAEEARQHLAAPCHAAER